MVSPSGWIPWMCLCGETAFARGPEFPLQDAGRAVQGIVVSVVATKIDDAMIDRGRRGHPDLDREPPFLRAELEVQGVIPSVLPKGWPRPERR